MSVVKLKPEEHHEIIQEAKKNRIELIRRENACERVTVEFGFPFD